MGCGGTKSAAEPPHTAPVRAPAPSLSAPAGAVAANTTTAANMSSPAQPVSSAAVSPATVTAVTAVPEKKPDTGPPAAVVTTQLSAATKAAPPASTTDSPAAPPAISPLRTLVALADVSEMKLPVIQLLLDILHPSTTANAATKAAPAAAASSGNGSAAPSGTVQLLHELAQEDPSKPWDGINLLHEILQAKRT